MNKFLLIPVLSTLHLNHSTSNVTHIFKKNFLDNAPFSKSLFFGVAAGSILSSIYGTTEHLQLKPSDPIINQLWKFLGNPFIFRSSAEILFGTLLIYHFRLLERHFGSRKYASLFFISTLLSSVFQVLFLLLKLKSPLSSSSLQGVANGPYGFLFSMLIYYFRTVPFTQKYQIGSLSMTEKSFLYLFAIQLMISKSFSSILASVSGILVGILLPILPKPFQKWRIPRLMTNLSNNYLLPLLQSSSSRSSRQRNLPHPDAFESATATSRTTIPSSNSPTPEPSETDIALLVSMGFHRVRVIRALRRSQNNVEMAAARLLDEATS